MQGGRSGCRSSRTPVTRLSPDRVSGRPPPRSCRHCDRDPGFRHRYRRALRGAAIPVHGFPPRQSLRPALRCRHAAVDRRSCHRPARQCVRAKNGRSHPVPLERRRELAGAIHGSAAREQGRTRRQGRGAPVTARAGSKGMTTADSTVDGDIDGFRNDHLRAAGPRRLCDPQSSRETERDERHAAQRTRRGLGGVPGRRVAAGRNPLGQRPLLQRGGRPESFSRVPGTFPQPHMRGVVSSCQAANRQVC